MQFLLGLALILMAAGMRRRRWLVVAGALLTLPITWYMNALSWRPYHLVAYASLILTAAVAVGAVAENRWLAWGGIILLGTLQAAFFLVVMTAAFARWY